MSNLKNNLSLCPHKNCARIPLINLRNNSSTIKISCNENNGPNTFNSDISNYLLENNNLQKKLLCSFCSKTLKENEYFFYCDKCRIFLCNQCYQQNIFHEHPIVKRTLSNFWIKCKKHELPYNKYCKTCGISLCQKCLIEPHKAHILIDIEVKNKNQIEEIKQNLSIQQNYYEKVKKIIYNCLNQMESELELKRLILNNYLNNSNNGNSVENINNNFSPLNQQFRQKIDNLNSEDNNKNSFEDKLLSLQYYYNMINNKQNNNNINERNNSNSRNNTFNDNNDNDNKYDNDNHIINNKLYKTVMKYEVITTDLINIVNVEKDGNCFYRVISYFLYNNQNKYDEIRNKIKERAREMHRNNPQNLHLIEGLDLSQTNYLNNRMNNGDFAGDYEISIAHQLFNINIAAYRKTNNNTYSFMRFYNDDNNNNRNLLILIFVNNNHFQLGFYKKTEKNNIKIKKETEGKMNENIGINKLKKEIENKSEIKEKKINAPITSGKKSNNNSEQKKKNYSNIIGKNVEISSCSEKNVITCMTRLSSGNLALGLSNGKIKIYNVNEICLIEGNYDDELEERNSLLTINDFRGKRISYLYELKDITLLCATYGKIHHVQLRNGDTEYDYIGSINLTAGELPKRIIELGNQLIVSLGEKKYRHENINRRKCIIKIFNKVDYSKKESEEDNSYCLFSDNSSIDSQSSNSEGWENVYSSALEDSFKNYKEKNEKNFKRDASIKLYKNDKNIDKLFMCSIFPINFDKNKNMGNNLFEFIATSNQIFYQGENYIQIYGVLRKQERHGFNFFIDKTIDNMPCSRLVDSICQLNKDYIGIGLQLDSQESINGIAVLNIKQREILTIIKGLSIGLLNTIIINRKFVFFTTNQTKDVKKCNELRLYKINNDIIDYLYKNKKKKDKANDIMIDYLDKNKDKLIFQYNSSFSCLVELNPSNYKKRNIFYVISSNKKLFIIKIENDNDNDEN